MPFETKGEIPTEVEIPHGFSNFTEITLGKIVAF